jgi:protoheme IX farnesyltransferase
LSKIKTIALERNPGIAGDFLQLIKFRLTLVVVITSMLGYMITAGVGARWLDICILSLGGFLVAGASNVMNQALEKDYDKLMKRTRFRPIADGRMSVSTGVMIAGVMCVLGLLLLSYFNMITAFLGALAFVVYAFIYTPLKRNTTWSVAVGAVPGALPVLIGCVAVEGTISQFALLLFGIQFLWQFPHFWSIGYLGFRDYRFAGFKLVPASEAGEVDRRLGWFSLLYCLAILPLVSFLIYLNMISFFAGLIAVLLTGVMAFFAFQFHRQFDRKTARMLMFSSLVYMPAILLIIFMDVF